MALHGVVGVSFLRVSLGSGPHSEQRAEQSRKHLAGPAKPRNLAGQRLCLWPAVTTDRPTGKGQTFAAPVREAAALPGARPPAGQGRGTGTGQRHRPRGATLAGSCTGSDSPNSPPRPHTVTNTGAALRNAWTQPHRHGTDTGGGKWLFGNTGAQSRQTRLPCLLRPS